MDNKVEKKHKTVTPKQIGRKDLSNMIDKRLFNDIDTQSVHHVGLINVTLRLANFVSHFIPQGNTTFLEIALSQAIADWHAAFINGQIEIAYRAFCTSIFKSLPYVMKFDVVGKALAKPHYPHTWDCTSHSIVEWINDMRIDPKQILVTVTDDFEAIDPRDSAFLLCSMVFTKQDLKKLSDIDKNHSLAS